MSLISSLNGTFLGLRDTEARLNVTSQNVANADRAGYSRKENTSIYTTVPSGTFPTSGIIESISLDPYLHATLVEDLSSASYVGVLSDYLSSYVDRLGNVSGDATLNAQLDDLAASLSQLSVLPEDAGLKAQVVADARALAQQISGMAGAIQDLRLQADQDIGQTVTDLNTVLQEIDDLNRKVIEAEALGRTTAEYEDLRRVALEELSGYIDFDYFVDSDNRLQIYTSGRPLVTNDALSLSYTASSLVDSTVVYPGGFSSIDFNGVDLTSSVSGGRIGALVELRDSTFVDEQAKLDEFASVLMDLMNGLLNEGASVPSRPSMIGDVEGLTTADAFAATGIVRIATTDQSGVVQNFADINLTAFANVGDVINGINAALGGDVTASLTADGELQLVANNAGEGISINEMTSAVAPDSDGFAAYFELNNLFDGTNAETIAIAEYLDANPAYLATGRLTSGALAVGDTGVFVGEGDLALALSQSVTGSASFAAAGNFAAQTNSLDSYADNILSDIARQASSTRQTSDNVTLLMEQTQTQFQNLIGVNIDEEMTKIIDLEAKYQAAARLISVIQDMFDELLASVR
ncbi:MAG: flagellar hook-associated protein FlgK [Bdellovibrionales bacterium]